MVLYSTASALIYLTRIFTQVFLRSARVYLMLTLA